VKTLWTSTAATAAMLLLAACGSTAVSASAASTSLSPPTSQEQQTQGTQAASPGPTSATCGGLHGISVSTASQLQSALRKAAPGTTIVLAPGVYDGNFKGTTSGTAAQPITLCGPRNAILDGGSVKSGYTFYLDDADWWRIEGFSIEGGQKGVVTDTSDHDLISGLSVHGIGDEGIHLRSFSSYDTVSHDVVSDTGLNVTKYGEGIYVGSANSNWCRYSGCKPDASDYDTITDNTISDTSAENIDIKEGTVGGLITGNHFNGAGMDPSAATSWVNVKGNDWKITGNTGIDSIQDGLSDHQVYPGWGIDNVFESNSITVDGPGYGIFVQNKRLGVKVYCNNQVTGAARGFSSVACTSA
jgi:hypothetical protein